MKSFLYSFLFAFGSIALAQNPATDAQALSFSLDYFKSLQQNSEIKNIPFENIGPKVMSGRVVALAVNPNDPTEFYVAYASGGLWHTTTNGISFTPISENAPTQNIGEIAVHWPTRTLWVGTGENNASRSSYAGIGMMKTSDNGKTWSHAGLEDSHHIGKILIHPEDPNHVIVGVTGHLYSTNAERGVYVTKDGGQNWKHSLYINDSTGLIDMATAPNNFNIQYAAVWEKDRKAWDFETANQLKNNAWYDVYNSVFHFQNNLTDNYYHKSKLVVGVEYMPYKKYLEPVIGEFLLDFGGTIATRGIQKNRTVFVNKKGIKTAPIVCYESIYGAFVTEYVRNGAQFLSILTNDAWWGKTQGHQQLFSYARLRAIENRRAIARSANTGISGFINTKGEILQSLAYEEQGALTGVVPLNSQLTFYSIYGDYLARWAIFLFGLFFFIALSGRLKEKAVF